MNTEQTSENIFTCTKVTFTGKIFHIAYISLSPIRIFFICMLKPRAVVMSFLVAKRAADIFVPKFGLLQTQQHLISKIYSDCIIVNVFQIVICQKHDFLEYISYYFSFLQVLLLLYHN